MKSLSRKLKRVRPLLGTYVHIELQGDVEWQPLNRWMTEGFEAVAQVDRLMSYHRPDSELTRLNQSKPNTWLRVSAPTREVLKATNELFLVSDGIFDIRCGTVLADRKILPSVVSHQPCRPAIFDGILPLEMKGARVRKTGPWILDLGGIAKGYAVDCAVKRIQRLTPGHRISGLVNAGGDLRVWGERSIPISPRIDGRFQYSPLVVNQTAVAASSVRKSSSFAQGLSAAAHVRMPSGRILSEAKTAMVFADKCIFADALTKIVLLGAKKLVQQCLSFYKARALVFGTDGRFEKVIQ